ncbi:MAG: 30S ribosomal protein S12 methylthiotransferase RimO [Fibrobacterales bacterium]
MSDQVGKKVGIINLGCSKNLVDGESIVSEFSEQGYELSESIEECEVILVNTCGFIESAKEESINEILGVCKQKQDGQKVVVTGCLSERYKEELKKEIPEVDLFVGNYVPGELIQKLDISQEELCSTGSFAKRILLGAEHHHAYLKISRGCNRTCGFCAIPLFKGKQDSRTIDSVVREAQWLQEQGIQEISLVAQDLTYFGREKRKGETLEKLLKTLMKETDIPWFRLMYMYPGFVDDGLLETIAVQDRICNYIDMPLQHGSDRMLKNMRRGHTKEQLLTILRKFRNAIPDLAIRTTFLLGYPGETEEDFQQLMEMVDEFKFDRLGCFTFSTEEGTPVMDMGLPSVPLDVAEERVEELMTMQQNISLERNQSLIGSIQNVIIDSVPEGSDYHFVGRTQWDAPEVDNFVNIVEGSADLGSFRKVQIIDGSEYDLEARFVD